MVRKTWFDLPFQRLHTGSARAAHSQSQGINKTLALVLELTPH